MPAEDASRPADRTVTYPADATARIAATLAEICPELDEQEVLDVALEIALDVTNATDKLRALEAREAAAPGNALQHSWIALGGQFPWLCRCCGKQVAIAEPGEPCPGPPKTESWFDRLPLGERPHVWVAGDGVALWLCLTCAIERDVVEPGPCPGQAEGSQQPPRPLEVSCPECAALPGHACWLDEETARARMQDGHAVHTHRLEAWWQTQVRTPDRRTAAEWEALDLMPPVRPLTPEELANPTYLTAEEWGARRWAVRSE